MQAPMPMVTFFKTLDVTNLVRISKKKGLKLNMLMCWCIGKAASGIKEFYMLPVGKKLIQYDTIAVNTIVTNKNGEVSCNYSIFRHDNFIGCFSADKIKMSVRKYFCFNIPVYKNMAEEPSCRSPYHEEYIQTSASGNPEGLCRSTYSFLSERR